jgi:hypothetical protein
MLSISVAYTQRIGACICEGCKFDHQEISTFLSNDVSERYFDVEGTDQLAKEFGEEIDITDTGFEGDGLYDIFQSQVQPIDWRIGEVLVELYLEQHNSARFHYRSSRDAKNPDSNSTGADLVGFVDIDNETLFLFGEVKSSNDASRPPTIWYGRTGLLRQLEGLKSNPRIRASLIRWLGFKVKDLDKSHAFRKDYSNALRVYYRSRKTKFYLVGALVRDVDPDANDLISRFSNLIRELDPQIRMDLVALYLPLKITELPGFLRRPDTNGN